VPHSLDNIHRRALLTAAAAGSLAAQQSGPQPNFLFICTDNFNPNMLGCAGHAMVRTPNIDRLASQGVYFSNGYCGSPVCAPARASLISGLFPSDVESYCNSTPFRGQVPTWGKRLQEAGYYCLATGKMDLTARADIGFDQVETRHEHEASPDVTSLFRRPLCYRPGYRRDIDGSAVAREHGDARVMRNALAFLRQDAPRRRQPWTLYVGYSGPLPGFRVEQKYHGMYAPEKVDLPVIPPGYLENLPEPWEAIRSHKRIAMPIPEDRVRRARAAYYGNITAVDERIGELLNELDRSGMRGRTVVIFTSDHGRAMGEHGLWLHDEPTDNSTRVPFVIAGPGIPAGRRVDTPVMHVDLFPTLMELAGAPVPSGLRGHSLLPLCNGSAGDHPGIAYCESHSEGTCTGAFIIRRGKWKYIHYTYYDSLLFDMEKDPGELQNVIRTPEGARVSRELDETLRALVDPTERTERAFGAQERILQDLCARMTLDQLLDFGFESRLGRGQAITLLKRYKK
jgi:choline-sulfatase